MSEVTTTIALPRDIDRDVEGIAKMLGIPKPLMIRIIIIQGLGHQARAKQMLPIAKSKG